MPYALKPNQEEKEPGLKEVVLSTPIVKEQTFTAELCKNKITIYQSLVDEWSGHLTEIEKLTKE